MIYVALLRGINVGGNNKVDMKTLKKGFEDCGLAQVQTYINSGNVVFVDPVRSAEAIGLILEEMIQVVFALNIKVIIRDLASFEGLMERLPTAWTNDKTLKSDVMFLWPEIDNEDALSVLPLKTVDSAFYVPGAVGWSVDRTNQAKSGQVDLVGTKNYKKMTIRNVNTVRKIYALMRASI